MTTTTKTAAELRRGSAVAAPSVTPRARGPQRHAPASLHEAGAGVTPTEGWHWLTPAVDELRLVADHEPHPYLIQIRRGHRLLAYAIRDAYGWAITACTGRRIRTVARAQARWGVEAALLQCAVPGYVPGGLEVPR